MILINIFILGIFILQFTRLCDFDIIYIFEYMQYQMNTPIDLQYGKIKGG